MANGKREAKKHARFNRSLAAESLSEGSSVCDGAVSAAVARAFPNESDASSVEWKTSLKHGRWKTCVPVRKSLRLNVVYNRRGRHVQQLVVGSDVHAHRVTEHGE